MNEKSYATADTFGKWENINFQEAVKSVKKLQFRIALAYQNGDIDKVYHLQNVLIHSFYARYLAVRIVTSNKGKITAGIDDTLYDTSDDKYKLIFMLKRRGYKMLPMKRIYIKKLNGTFRPLSIPTIKDRAMQTLYKFALEPIAEMTADDCSFGYRTEVGARDAICQCANILSNDLDMKWVLKTDIKSCFDNISHEWLIENIPMDKQMLMKFLKCGYVYNDVFYKTDKGVPQGGCLSSVLCNMTLDGLENVIYDNFKNSVRVIRYADDIILFGYCKALFVQEVLPMINSFLSERGLELSKEKTEISQVDKDFSFLGYSVVKKEEEVIITPQRIKVQYFLQKINGILKGDFVLSSDSKEKYLVQVLRGWFNYYKDIVTDYSLYEVEYHIMLLINNIGEHKLAEKLHIIFEKIFNKT